MLTPQRSRRHAGAGSEREEEKEEEEGGGSRGRGRVEAEARVELALLLPHIPQTVGPRIIVSVVVSVFAQPQARRRSASSARSFTAEFTSGFVAHTGTFLSRLVCLSHTSAYVSIRQHTRVSIRQHTSACFLVALGVCLSWRGKLCVGAHKEITTEFTTVFVAHTGNFWLRLGCVCRRAAAPPAAHANLPHTIFTTRAFSTEFVARTGSVAL